MRIPFRQGLVTAPANFLQLSGASVTLNIAAPLTVQVAFADGMSDYLHTERASVTNAWQGPFSSSDYWLYWDLNVRTGIRTFGHTVLEPQEGAHAPLSPAEGQHWFDTTTNTMKVWNSQALRWVRVIRTFATKLASGAVFTSMSIDSPIFTGTQIGTLNTSTYAGAIVFDTNGDVIKRMNGTFFTTEDVVVTSTASSTQVKLGAVLTEAVAVANIPAYSAVRFVDFHQINLANNYGVSPGAFGIVEMDVSTGSLVNVVVDGVITNPNWNWTAAGINAPIYVTSSGQLSSTMQPNGIPIGFVVDNNTIVLRPSLSVVDTSAGGSVDPATTVSVGIVRLSTASSTPTSPVVVETSDPRLQKVLDDLSDVTIDANYPPEALQVLSYDGSTWVPRTLLPQKPRPYDVFAPPVAVGTSADHNRYYVVSGTTSTTISIASVNDGDITGGDQWDANGSNPLNPGQMPIGGWVTIRNNLTSGTLNLSHSSSITLNGGAGGNFISPSSSVRLIKIGYDTWDVEGTLLTGV